MPEPRTPLPLDWEEIVLRSPWSLVVTIDGKTSAFVTEACAKLHGYTQEELVGAPLEIFLSPKASPVPEQHAAILASSSLTWESVHRHKSGRDIPVRLEATTFAVPGDPRPLVVARIEDLTEARRVAQDRAQLEARYNAVLRTARLPMTLCDLRGTILEMSDDGLRVLARPREEVVGKTLADIFPPPVAAMMLERHAAVVRSGEATVVEERLPVARGLGWFLSVISPVGDVGGGEPGVQIVTHDMTDRKVAADAAQILGRVLDSATEEIFVADVESLRILQANRAAVEHLGYTLEELQQLSAPAILAGLSGPELQAQFAPLARGAPSVLMPARQRRKDGSEYPVTGRIQVVELDGRPVLLAIVYDETERVAAQASLAASEARYRRLAETSRDIVFRYDLVRRAFEYVSPAVERILGIAMKDGQVASPALVALLGSGWDALLSAAVATSPASPEAVEFSVRRADGTIVWLNFRFVVVRDDTKHAVAIEGAATDVTARHQAEEAVRALAATLEKRVAERTTELEMSNRELEAFSYSVSHDLRAPLRSIAGFAAIALEEGGATGSPDFHDALDRIGRSVAKMGTLIDDLLRLSRLGRRELHVTPCDISAAAERLCAELAAPRATSTSTAPSATAPATFAVAPGLSAEADLALLEVLLRNLVENALKFSRTRAAPHIEIGREDHDGERAFFVRDNGIGFDMRYANKIFQVFERLHPQRDYEGTGIGLAIVARIAARHGGRAWAVGEPDHGATMYFTLAPRR